MNQTRLFMLAMWMFGSVGVARATPALGEARACVEASTRGQTERDEGRLLSARTQLLLCASEACPSIVKKSCFGWLGELNPRIPSVVVRVHDPDQRDVTDASVTIDDAAISVDGRPVMLDPGTHTVSVRAPDRPAVQRTFLLAEREQARLLIVELASPVQASREASRVPPTQDPALRTKTAQDAGARTLASPQTREESPLPTSRRFRVPLAGWLLAGVGVGGLASFVVLRIEDEDYLKALLRSCSPDCRDGQRERGKHVALGADVSLGVGSAVLAAFGAWTLGSWLRQRATSDRAARDTALSLLPRRGGAFVGLVTNY